MGIVFIGSGIADTASTPLYEKELPGMDNNASFLAPVPVNYTLKAYTLPHEIAMREMRANFVYFLLK